jgi:hypothetical protein
MNLFLVEVRRALHRRIVWVLLAVAVLGAVVAGVIAFADSAGKTIAELRANEEHPALMATWWSAETRDGILVLGAVLLPLGALIGGASFAGAEWKAGTIVTVLTWEPRRLRLQAARTAAAAACAAVLAFLLLLVLEAALLPAVLAHGSTDGVDGAWVVSVLGLMARISLVTGLAAAVGVALATVGRNTAAALALAWGWMVIGENAIRAYKPGLGRYLLGDNAGAVLTWDVSGGADFRRGPGTALATLVVYAVLIAAVAAWRFERQDVAAT